ncbi:MAG: YCF48-related protein [Bacteroidota bacterium]
MKKSICIIALFIIQTSILVAQTTPWQSINPLPQGQPLNGLWNVGADTIVAVGNYGTIIRTSNAGVTWNVQQMVNADTDNFNAVQFTSPLIGYVAGDDGVVLKTTDGGFTWVDQGFPLSISLYALYFSSSSNGWVTGMNGTIYKTTNGGTSWTAQNSLTNETIFSIQFVGTQTGFAFGTKGIFLKSTDGGSSWYPTTLDSTKSIYSAYFVSQKVGWAVGLAGYILKTTDGGQTWGNQLSPILTSFFSVQFRDSLNGLIGGSLGSILQTSDGGVTWNSVLPDLYDDMFAIRIISPSVGWAVGDVGRILSSTNGGMTWQLKSSGVKADLYSAYFPSLNIGYAVGDTGVVIKTTDGGLSWTTQNNSVYWPFYSVYFLNDTVGWAVGDSGYVIRTINGGATWTPKTTVTDNTLYSVYFINASVGWAVGDAGTILKSVNGGATWTSQSVTTITTFTKVHFINPSIGLVSVSDGTFWKTTNGGSSWIPKSTGVTQYLYSMAFLPDNSIIATGDYGEIIKSTDVGETWNDLSIADPISIYDVAFFNSQYGWAVSDAGEIISTTNGGQDWYYDLNPALTSFYSIQTIPSGSGAYIIASASSSTIVSSSINAFQRRTWTGSINSQWTNPGNWSPLGAPNKLDSILIPVTPTQPVVTSILQQLNIGTLVVSPGASINIHGGIAQLVCSGDISIGGSLITDTTAGTQIITGGSLIINPGGSASAGKNLYICNGIGYLRGTFNNLLVNPDAEMSSIGNITITKSLRIASIINLRQNDTLAIRNRSGESFSGQGMVTPGTILRYISPASLDQYRFETPATSIQFLGIGVYPDSVSVTTYLNGKPKLYPDSLFSPISYSITSYGGSNPPAGLCLRYDDNMFPLGNVSLFRDSSGLLINMGADNYADGVDPGICLDTTFLYARWYVGDGGFTPRLPYQFRNRLVIKDAGNTKDTLQWGAQPGATAGLDTIFGEKNLPAKPPQYTFDARWILSPSLSSLIDIMPILQGGLSTNIYQCDFQPGPGGYPMTLQWDNSEFPLGNIKLIDSATNGTKLTVYMKSQQSTIIYDPTITSIKIVQQVPAFYMYEKKWNLISMPQVSTINPTKVYNYPLAVSSAYGYNFGYYVADTIKNGPGYWLKFADTITVPIEGNPLASITIPVDTGWVIIGSIAKPVAPTDIIQSPSGTLVSPLRIYNYKAGYNLTDSVRPGYGYWVKVAKEGSITLGGTAAKHAAIIKDADSLINYNTVTIGDGSGGEQQLFFSGSVSQHNIQKGTFELPPSPPPGVLDVSFGSRQMVELFDFHDNSFADFPIIVRSQHYPLHVSIKLKENQIRSVTIINSVNWKVLGAVTPDQNSPVYISDPSISSVIMRVTYDATPLPKEFALLQNFPNPFNPTTVIRFQLPVQANVTLELFNILGQRVKFLLNQESVAAGTHDISFDGTSLASGVYFYRIRALGADNTSNLFHDVRKMLLIK